MSEKELTLSEVTSMGGIARSEKHGDKIPSWGKKGGDTTKQRYGLDHYRRIGKMGSKKKKLIKEQAPFGPGQCRKCGIHIDGDLLHLDNTKIPDTDVLVDAYQQYKY